MKRKLLALAALAALLLCAPGGPALAEPLPPPHKTMETDLRITFEEQVFFMTVEGKSMDIAFGEKALPAGETLFEAEDHEHVLKIADRRRSAGNWSVSAIISEFSGMTTDAQPVATSFLANLRLYSPAVTKDVGDASSAENSLTPNLTTDEYGEEHITVSSAGNKIADATKDVNLVDQILTFTPEDTRIWISNEEAGKAKPTAYSATVTWTLTLG